MNEEIFCFVLESLRLQLQEDKKNGELIKEAFNSDFFVIYDNSRLIKSIIKLLQIYFPIDSDGYCEISHYCFEMNFGKLGQDSEWETPQMLYKRLTK